MEARWGRCQTNRAPSPGETLTGEGGGPVQLGPARLGPLCRVWIFSEPVCLSVCRSKVYTADLESALHYLLRVELATHNTLEGEELKVFKDFVTLVAKVTTELQSLIMLKRHQSN